MIQYSGELSLTIFMMMHYQVEKTRIKGMISEKNSSTTTQNILLITDKTIPILLPPGKHR